LSLTLVAGLRELEPTPPAKLVLVGAVFEVLPVRREPAGSRYIDMNGGGATAGLAGSGLTAQRR
jgi:hypothetical protein